MALSTRKDEDEEVLNEIEETEETQAEGVTTAPAVSDRRRRRMLAQGLDPDAAPTSTATRTKTGPTPSRDDENESEKRKRSGNFITRWFEGFREYVQGVRSELRKVAWPSREDVERLTRIVLTVTAAASIVLGAISTVFGFLTASIAAPDWGTLAGIITIVIIIVVGLLWLLRDRLFPSYE
jgi:preprotein translocase SecE subunit